MRYYITHSVARADVFYVFLAAMLIASWYPGVAYAQQSAAAEDTHGFFRGMVGEWVGTIDQFTDGVKAPTKYFHALTTQTGPDSYETILDSYRIDPETRKPVSAGRTTVTTVISPDGTATDTIVGEGDVLIDVDTLRPQQHQFIETVRMSSPGVLQGTGSGTIKVSGMPFGFGRNGKVTDYTSAWSMSDGALRITQQVIAKFRILFFGKTFNITTDFTGRRGSDVMELIRSAEDNAAAPPTQASSNNSDTPGQDSPR